MSEPKPRKAKPLTPAQLADKLTRAHSRAIASLAAAGNCAPGTATWRQHWERYERRSEEHDALVALVRALEPVAPD
ncbi:hypothetical protein [Pseudomonas aeruginosa]